jgi:phage terminase small subunit
MPALKNSRHEAFARAMVAGMTQHDAYKAAGFKASGHAAEANASRLLKDAEVSDRVAELKKEAASDTVMSAREVLEEFSKIGRSSIQHYVVGGDDTSEVVEALRDLPPAHAAAIQEITFDTYTEGGGENAKEVKRVRFKLHDKVGALTALGRHHKVFKERDEPPAPPPPQATELDLEVARRIAFLLARATIAGGAPPPPPSETPAPAPKPPKK